MARNWQYTPRKRLLLQIVMWLILGGTVALAAAVSHHRKNALTIKLADPLTHGGVTIALPRDWKISKYSPADNPTILRAVDPKQDTHRIQITRETLGADTLPLAYLSGKVAGREVKFDPTFEKISIGDNPGILMHATGEMQFDMEEIMRTGQFPGPPTHYFAATVDAMGRGFLIEYESPDPFDRADEGLILKIAKSVSLDGAPAKANAGAVALSTGVSLSGPPDFELIPNADPQRTRLRWRSGAEGSLRLVTAIPVVLGPRDSIETIRTMLSLCKPMLLDSKIQPLGKGEWQMDARTTELENVHPIRGYAIASASSQGALVIFEGGDNPDWIAGAWETMRGSIQYRGGESLSDLTSAGARQAQRFNETGLVSLLGETRLDQSWLIGLKDLSRPMGWIVQEEKAGAWSVAAESRFRLPERRIHRTYYAWQGSTDLQRYQMSCDFSIADDEQSPAFEMAVKSSAKLGQGQIVLTSRTRDGEGSDVTIPAPANYIPGGWLAALLPHFDSEPALVRTDSIMGYGSAAPSDLLSVIVRTEKTSRKSADDQALRCKTVEVVGSGEMERWYFRPDGALDSVEGSEGFILLPRDISDIQMDFAREPAMKPSR